MIGKATNPKKCDFYLNAELPLFKKEYKTNVMHAVTDVPFST